MFTVIHANATTDSKHETEEDARKQVICAYGPNVFIDDNDRPSGRLRVWANKAVAANDFGAPIAKIELEKEEIEVAATGKAKKSPPVQATEPEHVDQSPPKTKGGK